MKSTLKLVTVEPEAWDSAFVSSNIKPCLLTLSKDVDIPTSYPVIPLNPRIRPINVVDDFDVYVYISIPIFKRP